MTTTITDNVEFITIKLVKSLIGRLKNHKASARGLGLTKIGQEIKVKSTPENHGMIKQISYLLEIKG